MSDLDHSRIERLCAEIEALAERAREYAERIGDNAAFANVAELLRHVATAVPAIVARLNTECVDKAKAWDMLQERIIRAQNAEADRAALGKLARALEPFAALAEILGEYGNLESVTHYDADGDLDIVAGDLRRAQEALAALPAALLAEITEMKDV